MDALRTGVFVLFVLLEPVSCKDVVFTEPLLCYFLDGILVIYCIVATAFFFREKFSYIPSVAGEVPKDNGAIYQELERPEDADPYQELERPEDADPYQELEPSRGKSRRAEQRDKDPYECLTARASAPALPPQ